MRSSNAAPVAAPGRASKPFVKTLWANGRGGRSFVLAVTPAGNVERISA